MTNPHSPAILRVAQALGHKAPDQVCILVENLEDGIDFYSALLGVAQWEVHDYSGGVFQQSTYRGEDIALTMRIALAGSSPQYELIEAGSSPSIYWDWIKERGCTMHHFGYYVDSLDVAIADIEAAGYPVVQSGRGHGLDGDGGFAYIEAGDIVLEILEPPVRRRAGITVAPRHTL